MNKPYWILVISGETVDMRQICHFKAENLTHWREYSQSCRLQILFASGKEIEIRCDPDTKNQANLDYNKYLENAGNE